MKIFVEDGPEKWMLSQIEDIYDVRYSIIIRDADAETLDRFAARLMNALNEVEPKPGLVRARLENIIPELAPEGAMIIVGPAVGQSPADPRSPFYTAAWVSPGSVEVGVAHKSLVY